MTIHAVTAALAGGGTYVPHAGLRKQTSAAVTPNSFTGAGVTTGATIPRATSAGVTPANLTGGVQDLALANRSTLVLPPTLLTSGTQDMDTVQHPMDTIGVAQTAITLITYYKKRARDPACITPTYVTWVTTNVSQVYPFALPCGGPLVEEIIAEFWQV